jgi:chromosome partitioning protein
MHDRRNRLSRLVIKELDNHFPHKIFNTIIPRNVRLAECPSYGRPISHYDENSKGAKAYRKLAEEIIKHYDQNE